jgi:hypothetical protein
MDFGKLAEQALGAASGMASNSVTDEKEPDDAVVAKENRKIDDLIEKNVKAIETAICDNLTEKENIAALLKIIAGESILLNGSTNQELLSKIIGNAANTGPVPSAPDSSLAPTPSAPDLFLAPPVPAVAELVNTPLANVANIANIANPVPRGTVIDVKQPIVPSAPPLQIGGATQPITLEDGINTMKEKITGSDNLRKIKEGVVNSLRMKFNDKTFKEEALTAFLGPIIKTVMDNPKNNVLKNLVERSLKIPISRGGAKRTKRVKKISNKRKTKNYRK